MYEIGGEQYLSSKEAAKRIGVTSQTLRNWRTNDRPHMPYIKLGMTVIYRLADVEAYAKRHQHN